jgi:hypothetical protein
VPVYTIFTNEQLAQMVKARAAAKGDLEKIAGLGALKELGSPQFTSNKDDNRENQIQTRAGK